MRAGIRLAEQNGSVEGKADSIHARRHSAYKRSPTSLVGLQRQFAQMLSEQTGLIVTLRRLRRFKEEIDEEVIEDGRVRSLNRVLNTAHP
jgi:hypothetical protein